MTAHIAVTVRDYGGELSTVRFPVPEMSAITVWGDTLAQMVNLENQVDALSLGVVVGSTFSQDGGQPDQSYPADDAAQRETALRVFYHGNTSGKRGYVTIPAADLGAVELVPGTEIADPAQEPIATFITNFEAIAAIAIPSELGGYWSDEVTVDKIIFVGRNS